MKRLIKYLFRLAEMMEYRKLLFGKLVGREPISRIDTYLAGISKRTLLKWGYDTFALDIYNYIYPDETVITKEEWEDFIGNF